MNPMRLTLIDDETGDSYEPLVSEVVIWKKKQNGTPSCRYTFVTEFINGAYSEGHPFEVVLSVDDGKHVATTWVEYITGHLRGPTYDLFKTTWKVPDNDIQDVVDASSDVEVSSIVDY